ncbi:MAG TPA: tol-pal system protein YbgF [Paucimonas sp.]|nr:tol-pal system protein YbgF [Paucimonas sp.]HJW57903.1 tol-pal system protein YbgF [Burkholderiaceae bacterium]
MNTHFKSVIAAAFMAAFSLAPLQAHAGLFDDDEARRAILEIRSRIDALQRDTNALHDDKADKAGALDLVNQNEQLRQEIAKLRGQVEMLTNELTSMQQRQKDFYVDLDSRLRKMEPQKMTIDGKEASVEQNEQKAYDAALASFKAGDYRNAGASFFDFLRRYPQSGYAASAQYWLGNTYYAQRDYRNAITAQQVVVKNYPDSPKAPDALLNIASCYTELKDKSTARKTLETLVAQYGDSPAAQTAKQRLTSLK